jgi:ADP-heptose:LPS heptosyltransferase
VSRRALVLRALGLGDFLTGVPALRALRRGLPDHAVVLAAPAALRPLVELADVADELLPVGELEPVPWTGPPPDLAIDLHGNGPASKALLQVLDPGCIVAFGGPGAGGTAVSGPEWRVQEHETARWCRLVSTCLGVPADPADLRIEHPRTPPAARGAVVVHAGAASAARRWPEERFAEVAGWATRAGARVVLTGSESERPIVERVRRLAGLPRDSCLAGRTDLAALAAVVADARLVVCGDTGVAHLATAYGTPSVVLFGPTPPAWWGPPASGPHEAVWYGTEPGNPHGDTVDPALLRITAADVVRRAAVSCGLPAGVGGPAAPRRS